MAKTCNQFDRLMKIVEKVDIRVKEYLKLVGYDKWSRMHALVHRDLSMTLNIAESINVALVSARELSIYDFIKEVRLMFGRWNYDNKNEASLTFTPLIGKFQETLKINEAMKYAQNVNNKGRNYIVCLQKKKCTCGSFQYKEIPCEHAWVIVKFKSLGPDEFCSNFVHTDNHVEDL
ncbi:uncharacterized protein [Solanum lycopersicum]|uniref:uncharacterized protein n=1 Tax=Solanum lycopersicum TaxID=4081 RepID=UPI0037495724